MYRFSILGFLAVALLLVGCDSGGGNERETIAGTWQGTVQGQGTEYTVQLTLQQFQRSETTIIVEGSGTVQSEADSLAFTIQDGSFTPSSGKVLFPQQYEMGRPGQMRGTVADDFESMTVMMFGGPASFGGEEFTLTKR